jgi:hypothetical protein
MARGLDRGADEWASPGLKFFFPNSKLAQNFKIKKDTFCCSKNIQILREARFKYSEQLSQLGRLQIQKKSCYMFGTDSNLNLL